MTKGVPVSKHRSQRTGTFVIIVRAVDFDLNNEDGKTPYYTICSDHKLSVGHRTLKLARSFSPVPDEWCEHCQNRG